MATSAGVREEIRLEKLSGRPMVGNRVLVKVPFVPDDGYTLDSGIVVAGSKWNEADHVARFGEVVSVPDTLVYGVNELNWKTEMEVEPGDSVFWGIMAGANAPVIHVGDDLFYVMNYSDLIMRKRGDELYPLNGYAILEKVTNKTRRNGLELDCGDFQDKQLGVVKYVGRANDYYRGTKAVDADVEPGDEVVFANNFWTKLESEVFSVIDEELGYCQRCWIIGKL